MNLLEDLPSLLARAAATVPDEIYLVCGERRVTYRGMFDDSKRLAQALVGKGWAAGGSLGIALKNPLDFVNSVWAGVLAGVDIAFIPVRDHVETVQADMLDVGAQWLLTDAEALLGFERSIPMRDIPRVDAPLSNIESGGAFLMQTSGTTGEPQWVINRYDRVASAIHAMHDVGATEHAHRQTVFISAPLSHSYGLSTLLEYTYAQSTIVLPNSISPLGSVGELLAVAPIVTAIEGVPYFYAQLARLARRISRLSPRHVGFGGGRISQYLQGTLRENWKGFTTSVRYGLTETPSVVAHKLYAKGFSRPWMSSGRVTPAYGLRVVDDRGCTVSDGTEGRLLVSGVSTYLGLPASDWLDTGDVGYIDANGELVVVGQRSAFIKYQGYRLSPERIEVVFLSMPGVEDCRVLLCDDGLVAEIVFSDHDADIWPLVLARLPSYAQPSRIEPVTQIPRTASGKILRY